MLWQIIGDLEPRGFARYKEVALGAHTGVVIEAAERNSEFRRATWAVYNRRTADTAKSAMKSGRRFEIFDQLFPLYPFEILDANTCAAAKGRTMSLSAVRTMAMAAAHQLASDFVFHTATQTTSSNDPHANLRIHWTVDPDRIVATDWSGTQVPDPFVFICECSLQRLSPRKLFRRLSNADFLRHDRVVGRVVVRRRFADHHHDCAHGLVGVLDLDHIADLGDVSKIVDARNRVVCAGMFTPQVDPDTYRGHGCIKLYRKRLLAGMI